MNTLCRNRQDIKRNCVLFLLIFLLKGLVLIYLARLSKCQSPDAGGLFSLYAGDAFSYIGAMENYISKGKYFFIHEGKEIFAGRLPYYGLIYYVLRLLFKPIFAFDCLIIFQIAVESLSIIYLAFISKKILNNSSAFYIVIILSLLSLNISYWSIYLLPESLSVSCLIFFIYHYYNYKSQATITSLIFSALFLTFLILFKPYFILLIGFIFIDLLWSFGFNNKNIFSSFKITTATCFFVVLFLLPWIIRNYHIFHRFIPLQETSTAGYNYTKSDLACRHFIQSWGGTADMYWDKRSAGCYFMQLENISCEFELPEYVITKGYNESDINEIRNKYLTLRKNYNDSLDIIVAAEFDRLTSIFKSEKPFRYLVVSPILITKNFLINSGSYYLPVNSAFKCYKPYQLCLKFLQTFVYYFLLLVGFIGLFSLLIQNKSTWLLVFLPFFIIGLFCFYIRASEFRFFTHAMPSLTIGATYLILLVRKYIINKQLFKIK